MNDTFLEQNTIELMDLKNSLKKINYQDLKTANLQLLDILSLTREKNLVSEIIGILQLISQDFCEEGNHIQARVILRLIIELCAENLSDTHEKIIKNALKNLFIISEKEDKAAAYQETYRLLQHFHELFKNSSKGKMNLPLIYTIFYLGQTAIKTHKIREACDYYTTIITENDKSASDLSGEDRLLLYTNFATLIVINGGDPKLGQHYLEEALSLCKQYPPP